MNRFAQTSCITSARITCCLFILSLYFGCHSCYAQLRNGQPNSDNRSIGSAEESQDSNSDSSDTPRFDSSNGDSETDETGLMPPNELSVIRLNDTSVVLRWDFNENLQSNLQFFKVQYKSTKKGTQEWKTDNREIVPSTRAYQINGLRPGNHLFCVTAVYDNDDSIPSQPLKYRLRARSKISPDEMPELTAPNITWTEAKHDYFRFKWKYTPKMKDMPYYGFLVYYRSAHTMTDFTIYNTLDENVEIAEVEPETPYEAKVVAYNQQGISEFSETITIKTEPMPNSTDSTSGHAETTSVPTTTTTMLTTVAPTSIPIASISTTTRKPLFPSDSSSPRPYDSKTTTQKPNVITSSPPPNTQTSQSSNSPYQLFLSMIDLILEDKGDSMLVVRYLLIVMLPIVFVVLVLVCLLSRHRGNKDSQASSSTDGSMQFDLEINGYFKNSFPSVEKEQYSSVNDARHHHHHNQAATHHGFINNHPSINDFA